MVTRLEQILSELREGPTVGGGRLTAAAPEPAQETGGGFGRLVGRLVSPLVDVPELPGGIVGEAIERGIEELSSPVGLVSAALVPFTGGASLGLRGGLGVATKLGTRALGEVALGGAASTAAREVAERLPEDTPGILKLGAVLGAGAAAGIGTGAVLSRASGATLRTTQVARESALRKSVFTPEAGELAVAINAAEAIPKSLQRRSLATQRAKQAARAQAASDQAIASGKSAEEAGIAAASASGGSFSKIGFDAPTLSDTTVDGLFETARTSTAVQELDRFTARRGLQNLLHGAVPPQNELDILEQIYGPGLVQAIQTKQGMSSAVMAAINTPRAIVASMDLSAPLRQGVMLVGKPRQFLSNIKPMLHAFINQDYFDDTMAYLRHNADEMRLRNYNQNQIDDAVRQGTRAQAAGLELTGSLSNQEEMFIGAASGALNKNLLGRGVAASERSYTLYLNKLRRDVFNDVMDNWQRADVFTPERAKEYATFLNRATGRGPKGITQGNLGKVLNAGFFAPGYTISRFMAPKSLLTTDPVVRRQIGLNFGAFLGTGMVTLGIAAAGAKAGLLDAKIESDPRSADFGKIRIGNTRYDFWGGYQQIARNTAQILTESRKTSGGDIDNDTNRAELFLRFLRSKTSPQTGLVWDVAQKEDFLGNEIDVTDPNIVADKILKDRLLPLAIQDIEEGLYEGGAGGAAMSVPGIFGVGVSTYTTMGEVKDRVAGEMFNKPWSDLTGSEQRLAEQSPRILEKQREFENKAGASFGETAAEIDSDRLLQENAFMARLVDGDFATRREFADAMGEAQLRAATRRQQAADDFGMPGTGDPASPLQAALFGWRELFNEADLGAERGILTGQIDWDKFNQIEASYLKTLTSEQRDFVDHRRLSDHDPTVQWFFNNKNYVSNSGYYDVVDTSFERFASVVQKFFPSALTYSDLVSIETQAKFSGNRADASRATTLLNRIRRDSSTKKERMRRQDPNLDSALWHIGSVSTVLTPAARRVVPELVGTE